MAEDDEWKPLSARMGEWPEYDQLDEGFPYHLQTGVWDFLRNQMSTMTVYFKVDAVRMHRQLRISDWNPFGNDNLVKLVELMRERPRLCFEVLDYILHHSGRPGIGAEVEKLLREAGSAWAVSPDGKSITRRVDPTSVASVEAAIKSSPTSGVFLAAAWQALYGVHPDYGKAYSEALKAIEAAAKPIAAPNDGDFRLGKLLGNGGPLPRDESKRQIQVANMPAEDGADATSVLRSILWLFMKAEAVRHGSDEAQPPQTRESAEVAVHLAIAVVHFFTRQIVVPVPKK